MYNIGKNTAKEYDELYFNLIGDQWDTSISNITISIQAPNWYEGSSW